MVRPYAPALTFAAALMASAPAGAEVLVLQNDNFADGSFTCNLGIGQGETIAARFTAPPSAYPYIVRRLLVLACSSSGLEQSTYALDMWHDGGTLNPGGVLWSSGSTGYVLDSNGFNTIDVRSEGIISSGTIRVGLYHVLEFGSVGFATDSAITAQRNLVQSAAGVWSLAETAGFTGDVILRLEVETDVIFEDGFEAGA